MTLSLYDANGALRLVTVKPAPVNVLLTGDGINSWNNQPAALTELFGNTRHRTKADLLGYTDARVLVQVASVNPATGATMAIQYSTDEVTWAYLDGASGPVVAVDNGANTLNVSPWVTLAAGAKSDVFMRSVGENGDGVIDPRYGAVVVQFRAT